MAKAGYYPHRNHPLLKLAVPVRGPCHKSPVAQVIRLGDCFADLSAPRILWYEVMKMPSRKRDPGNSRMSHVWF